MVTTLLSVFVISALLFGIPFLLFPSRVLGFFDKLGAWNRRRTGTPEPPEKQQPRRLWPLRLIGAYALILVLGITYGLYLSYNGPGMLAAFRQVDAYLETIYGPANQKSYNIGQVGNSENIERLQFQYGPHGGVLKATWDGERYQFTPTTK